MEISRPADMRDCKRRFGYPGTGADIRYARKRAGGLLGWNGGGIGVSESVCHRPGMPMVLYPDVMDWHYADYMHIVCFFFKPPGSRLGGRDGGEGKGGEGVG